MRNYELENKRDNIECVKNAADSSSNHFRSYYGDIRDMDFLNRVFEESHPDIVIHLAACAGVRPSILNPVMYGYCDAISWGSAKPGDLAFYPDCEHVGIVVKNNTGTLTVIHCASGIDNVDTAYGGEWLRFCRQAADSADQGRTKSHILSSMP